MSPLRAPPTSRPLLHTLAHQSKGTALNVSQPIFLSFFFHLHCLKLPEQPLDSQLEHLARSGSRGSEPVRIDLWVRV